MEIIYKDEKDFIEAVKSGRVSPVVYSNNKYESLDINQMLYNKPIYKEAI